MDEVIILLSTFNGEKYLKEQLDSLIQQTHRNIKILIRDDGSTDKTVDIIQQFKKKYNNIIFFEGENLGPAKSFITLIKQTPSSQYYAFCDQDDIWKKEKIEQALMKIKSVKEKDIPILYFSNTELVDKNLKMINNIKKIDENRINIGNALIENIATGCTVVFNKELYELLKKIEMKEIKDGYMHDSLAYRIAYLTGKVIYDNNSFILYRQHDNNVIGNSSSLIDKLKKRKNSIKKTIKLRSNMAKYLFEKYYNDIKKENIETIKQIAFYNQSFENKIKLLFNNNISRMGKFDDILYRIAIILEKL